MGVKEYPICLSLINIIRDSPEDEYVDCESAKAILKNKEFNFLNSISIRLINKELLETDINIFLDDYSNLKEFISNSFCRKLSAVNNFIEYLHKSNL